MLVLGQRGIVRQGAPRRAKLMLRNFWSGALGFVPLAWLQPLRIARARAPETSLRYPLLDVVVGIVRHRKVDASMATFSLPDNPSLRLVNADSFITRRVYWLGQHGYEGHEGEWWAHFCRHSKGILEVGANVGFYTVLGAKSAPSTPYIAIEPHPKSAAILRQNLALNGLGAVDVVEAALVGRKTRDVMELSIPDEDGDYETPCGAFLNEGMEGLEWRASRSVEVKVLAAGDVVGNGSNIDLVKIDVEGHEFEILSTVNDWISSSKPTMFIELLPKAQELRRLAYDLCDRHGYRLFAVEAAALREAPKEALLDERFPRGTDTKDVVLTARPDAFGL